VLPCRLERPDYRDLGVRQGLRKRMFFEDLIITPTIRPVKLGHHHGTVFQVQLVDAVFVGAQGHLPPVAKQPDAGQRVHHHIRGE